MRSSVLRQLQFVMASLSMFFSARSVLADGPPPDESVPTVVRPAPPPVPEPADSEDEGGRTVLGRHVSHGAYGGPSLKVTSLAGDGAMFVGGEGGWIIGHQLVLGGGGYASVTDVVSPQSLQPARGNAHLSMGYGGFRFGGIVRPRRLTHLVFGVLVGGGGASSTTRDGFFRQSDGFFVVEPDLAAEVNLATHVRIGIGGSYRFVGGTDVSGFTSTRLSGPAAGLTLRFGKF